MSYVQQARAYLEEPRLIEGLLSDEVGPFSDIGSIDGYRTELYSLVAIMIDDLVDVFEDEAVPYFSPYGFFDQQMRGVNEIDDFMQLYATARLTIQTLASGYLASQAHNMTPIYQRTNTLCSRFHDIFPAMEQYDDVANLISAGINTAALVTIESLKAVSRVAQAVRPDVSNEEIAEIARRSERLIIKTANMPISQIFGFETVVNSAANESKSSDAASLYPLVYLENEQEQGYVDFAEPTSRLPDSNDPEGRPLGETRTELLRRLGCPALAHLHGNEPSAVQRLWRHMVNVAEAEELFTMAPDVYLRIAA